MRVLVVFRKWEWVGWWWWVRGFDGLRVDFEKVGSHFLFDRVGEES